MSFTQVINQNILNKQRKILVEETPLSSQLMNTIKDIINTNINMII